jgi:hypothetical protein
MIASILSQAWRVYRERFALIAAVVVVVWLPCELLSSYFDAFVFAPDDLHRSFKLAQFLDNFIGIIATAGVTFIAFIARSGQAATFGSAIGAGFGAWGAYVVDALSLQHSLGHCFLASHHSRRVSTHPPLLCGEHCCSRAHLWQQGYEAQLRAY